MGSLYDVITQNNPHKQAKKPQASNFCILHENYNIQYVGELYATTLNFQAVPQVPFLSGATAEP